MNNLRFKINLWRIKFRDWVVSYLFNEDEKYLIAIAIDDRREQLEKIAVRERWADSYEISKDMMDYEKIRPLFSTREWN